MSDYIQPEKLLVNQIFSQDTYSIPIYQRSYAWEKDQIEQLINDIYDASNKDVYYIGSLIVDEQAKHLYSVIDGQQRLTTLYLLMSYLQQSLLKPNCLQFEARKESNNILNVLLNYDFSDDKDFESDEHYNDEITTGIKRIQSFFRTKDKLFKRRVLENLDKIILIRTQVPKNIDLNHYFEIMNTRGEQLELHEIAKGRILSRIIDSFDKAIAAKIWDACAHMDEYVQMCFDNEVRPFIFGENWKEFNCNNFDEVRDKYLKVIKEKAIKAKKEPEELKKDTETIYHSLFALIKDGSIKSPAENKDEEENERFEAIISFPNFLMIVNEALHLSENEEDEGLDDKNFIKKLEYIWNTDDNHVADKQCKDFIFEMLKMKFFFDKYILKREFAKDYKNEGKWSLQRLEKTINNGQEKPKYVTTFYEIDKNEDIFQNIRALQSALRITYTSPKTMHWISHLLHFLHSNYETGIRSEDIINFLEIYACKKVKKSEYQERLGFAIERIVFTYLDYILYRDNKEKFSNFQFQFRTSIEHFHPQHSIEKIDSWNETEEDRNLYLNYFGNLVLITVKANSRFSNLSPNSKIDSYGYVLEQSLKFILMNEMREKEGNWTKLLVRKHGEEMLDLLTNEINKKLENFSC